MAADVCFSAVIKLASEKGDDLLSVLPVVVDAVLNDPNKLFTFWSSFDSEKLTFFGDRVSFLVMGSCFTSFTFIGNGFSSSRSLFTVRS